MDAKKNTVILKTSDDWRKWIEQLRTEATKENVWDYIDPDPNRMMLEPAPAKPKEPVAPEIDLSKPSEAQLLLQKYQIEANIYDRQLNRYEKHQKRMKQIRSYILDTVYIEHKPLIRDLSEVSEILKKLKEKLAPKENREKISLLKRHRELTIPKKGMKPKELAKKWRELRMDMNLAKFDGISSEQLARDFIDSTEGVLPKFHDTWTTTLLQFDLGSGMNTLEKEPTIDQVLDEFDSWTEAFAKKDSSLKNDIVMATLGNKSDQPEKKNDRSATTSPRQIICEDGEPHGFEDCPYINPEKRTATWKPDPDIMKKFEALEKDRSHPKARKLRWIKKQLEQKNKGKKENDSLANAKKKDEKQEQSNFSYDSDEYCGTVLEMALTASTTSANMKDEWILDSGSTIHITNNRDRIRDLGSEVRWILVGNTKIKMIGPGEATLFPTEPINDVVRQKGIRLKEVWFVEGMHTNVVSLGRLQMNGIMFDGKNECLWSKRTNKDLCNVKCEGKLFLLEWPKNPIQKNNLAFELAMSSFEKQTLKDTALVWHKRFGHVSTKAIEKLEQVTEGAVVTSKKVLEQNQEGFKEKCETCEISQAHRKISRVPMTTPTRPFQVLFVDIIVMNMAINQDTYALHGFDPYSKFHCIVTTRTKSVNFDLERMIEEVEHTFKTAIEEIHTDGESSINGQSFKQYCQARKKRLTVTIPNTPEQNGPAEKAGAIISLRARSLIQEANLREGLWPEAMKAAVWIMNRTPVKSLGYKTPYEIVHGVKPYVGNLFLFGSKAYVRIDTKKSEKMAPRAQIGYLVGYEAHNIWRIWTIGPNGTKVIRARDVVFDETKKYDPDHPFAKEIIREGVIRYVDNIDIPNIDEADPDIVFDSVDDDLRLQQSSIYLGPPMAGGSASPHEHTESEQPAQSLDKPQDMEIDSPPTESVGPTQPPQAMEIDDSNEPGSMEIDKNGRNEVQDEKSMTEIGSAGGVKDKNKDKVEIEKEVDEDIPRSDDGKTNSPIDQLRQLPNPVTSEKDSTNQNASNQTDNDDIGTNKLITPPNTPPSNEPIRGQGNQQLQVAPRNQEISADFSETNIISGSRIRKASKRALSPESLPLSNKRRRKQERAFFARQKLLQDSSLAKAFFAATEKLEIEPTARYLPPEPKNWTGVLRHKYRNQFIQAAKEEFETLKRKGTFEFVPRPQNTQILPLTWIFKYKFDKFGKISKFKARICVRGDLQTPNELETRAATLAARVFRLMMALAAVFDLEIVQYDAVNAFVNSALDEEVYTYFPDGFKKEGLVIKLRRALYGLRRSPRLWQKELTKTLLNLGFTQVPDEECLFIKNGVILLFFVDDILVFYDKATKQRAFEEIEKGLTNRYELRKMDKFEWFLNIRIIRDRVQRKIWLCQDAYISKIAERFELNTKMSVKTPISSDIEISSDTATNQEIHAYQELVGSALYAAVMTRIDVIKAISELSKHTKNPSKAHFQQIRRVIQYLYSTRFLAIEYAPPEESNMDAFVCASDASFGDNVDRTSSEGYLVQLYGGPIDWKATKQRFITTSTTEAELRAATEAAKRLQVWKRVFKAIDYKPDRELSIKCDNKQTVSLLISEEPQFRTNLKHIDIYHHWLRQEVRAKRLQIDWVDTKSMVADGLTKVLRGQRFLDWRQHQGLVDISHLMQE
ncbi:hypothetical protein TSTA_100530 [Talaromyces stipitatus ATCC 10500]|uniref:Integrase catalytic domain-containing protein n=1 Tax=Talaromyces stipitatus (strain ATCC 10500 / CBS 375.48 / QM 6759 / NRRL 1006) TaxID=441959 RepID=B8MLU1_TALSN|nr:uncharacterized protein TSTA_100530 [Talaromyces stipitatus ATCC 10500]EED13808.1 hypothetical protein TSTA_100530 [Talaromyces stipitatus ATCC 10500]